MIGERFEITIKYTVDRDAIPGWGHQPENWIDLATHAVSIQTHYHPEIEVMSVATLPPQPSGQGEQK